MIVRVCMFAALLACLVSPALAQAPPQPAVAAPKLAPNPAPKPASKPRDPQAVAIARDYARIAELTAALSRSLPMVSEQIVRQVRQRNPNAGADTIKAFSDALFDEFLLKRAGEIEAALVEVLLDTYTIEELTALKTFYSTPMGRSIIQKQAALGTKLPEALQDWTKRAAPEAVQAAGARLKAAGKELRL